MGSPMTRSAQKAETGRPTMQGLKTAMGLPWGRSWSQVPYLHSQRVRCFLTCGKVSQQQGR